MSGGLRLSLIGVMLGLLALAGCGRGFFQGGERAAWRHEAEAACMKSGAVKLGAGVVQIEPIEGPGICGADFPLRVSTLGDAPATSFADPVPPAAIPNASRMPDLPPPQQRYLPPARIEVAPGQHEELRWMTGPPPAARPPTSDEPVSLAPPGNAQPDYVPSAPAYPPARYVPRSAAPAVESRSLPDDIPPDADIPPGGSAAVPQQRMAPAYPSPRNAYNAPAYEPREPPRLGPAPYNLAAMPQAQLTPPATLACPLVAALDRWVTQGVQPAAMRWFGSPVVSIKQISAYSCRAMVGSGTNHISEHAFGNAIDIAAFTLADGRVITVKDGWHGSPEEQGFLHDVQGNACDVFTTVLSPGYNAAHYNHIHVDLMRHYNGRHICEPSAISGQVAFERARAQYAAKHGDPGITGALGKRIRHILGYASEGDKRPDAEPGDD